MRAAAWLAWPALALVLLAAHLLHAGLLPLAVASVLLIGLLWVRRPWAGRVVQVVLAIATVEWAVTAVGLAQQRMDQGQPYLRLLVILCTVTVLTALAVAAIEHRALRRHFGFPIRGLGQDAA